MQPCNFIFFEHASKDTSTQKNAVLFIKCYAAANKLPNVGSGLMPLPPLADVAGMENKEHPVMHSMSN